MQFLQSFGSLHECLEHMTRDQRGVPYLTKGMRNQLQAEIDEGYGLCTEMVSSHPSTFSAFVSIL
jgi:hypothetical protein